MRSFLLLLILLVLFSTGFSATREQEINYLINYLSIDENLDSLMNTINSAMGSALFSDAIYEVNIGSVKLEALVRNGRIVEFKQPVSIPDKIVYMSFDTVFDILNSANPAQAAFMALINKEIIVTDSPVCKSDSSCADNEVCINGACTRAFTIAVLPFFYSGSESSVYHHFAEEELNVFLDAAPVNRDLVRVHYVEPGACIGLSCTNAGGDCQSAVLQCARRAGLNGVADKFIGFSNNDTFIYLGQLPIPACGASALNGRVAFVRAPYYNIKPVTLSDGVSSYLTELKCRSYLAYYLGRTLGLSEFYPSYGCPRGGLGSDCRDPDRVNDIMNAESLDADHFGPAALNKLKTGILSDYPPAPVSLSGSECVIDSECGDSEACRDGYCRDVFTVSVIGLNYDNEAKFAREAGVEVNYFLSKANVSDGLIRFHYVPCLGNNSCNDVNMVCPGVVLNCNRDAGLEGVADALIGFNGNDSYVELMHDYYVDVDALICGYNFVDIAFARDYALYLAITGARDFTPYRRVDGSYELPQLQCIGSLAFNLGTLMGLQYYCLSPRCYQSSCSGLDCNAPLREYDIMNRFAFPKDHFGPNSIEYIHDFLLNHTTGGVV